MLPMKKVFLIILLVFAVGIVVIAVDENIEVSRMEKANDAVAADLPPVVLTVEDTAFILRLYDNETARALAKNLPAKLMMSRRGDGMYFAPLPEKTMSKVRGVSKRRAYHAGEAALMLRNNALCLMFGATPAGVTTNVPMLPAAGVPVGRLESYDALDQLPAVVEADVSVKK